MSDIQINNVVHDVDNRLWKSICNCHTDKSNNYKIKIYLYRKYPAFLHIKISGNFSYIRTFFKPEYAEAIILLEDLTFDEVIDKIFNLTSYDQCEADFAERIYAKNVYCDPWNTTNDFEISNLIWDSLHFGGEIPEKIRNLPYYPRLLELYNKNKE